MTQEAEKQTAVAEKKNWLIRGPITCLPLRRLQETKSAFNTLVDKGSQDRWEDFRAWGAKKAAADKQVMQHIFIETFSRGVTWAYKGQDSRKKNSSNEMGWTKKQTINAFSTLDTGKNQVWEGGTGQQNIKHTPMIWNRQWQLSFLHFIL